MARTTLSRNRWALWGPPLLLALVISAVLVLIGSRFASTPASPAQPILVASGDWEPFVGPDLPGGGPVAAVVTEVLQRQGYAPEVGFTTWPLALQRTEEQSVVATFPFVGTASRRADYLLSDPLLDFDYRLFVRRDDEVAAAISSAADLETLRVAHIAGYEYWAELVDAVPSFIEYASKEAAFDALASGEVDVVPEGSLSGEAVLAAPGFAGDAGDVVQLEADDNPLLGSTEALHVMLAPTDENRRILEAFNDALAEVKQTELYDGLVAGLGSDGSAGEELTLQPVAAGRLIVLRDPGERTYVAPAGTRVRVLSWPPALSEGVATLSRERIDVQVKVLSGPLLGRVLRVDVRSLVLGEAP